MSISVFPSKDVLLIVVCGSNYLVEMYMNGHIKTINLKRIMLIIMKKLLLKFNKGMKNYGIFKRVTKS